MRLIGLDFGAARIGLAVSDPSQIFASPKGIISTQKTFKATAASILQEIVKHGPIQAIIIGLPIHLNGNESPLSSQVRQLKEELEKLTLLPIILWDERLTTAQSERMLKEANLKRKKRASCIDAVSAAAILQNYLDAKRPNDTRNSL